MKKELIKQIDLDGIWYYTTIDGEKVTPYTIDYEEALIAFENYKAFTPSKEVIKSQES